MFTFGLRPPETANPKYWWGARAIFSKRFVEERRGRNTRKKLVTSVELLYDRQSYSESGRTRTAGNADFLRWINATGLPKVREWAESVGTDSRARFSHAADGYTIIATPNGSYGYMYIGAWSDESCESEEKEETA